MSKSQVTISLDCMGGDFGVSIVVPAALDALSKYKHLSLILVGDEDAIKKELGDKAEKLSSRLSIQHATQVVGSSEAPSSALRGKKDSSMRVAINLVKEGKAQASVSAGNTGALMATARFVLKTLPGINRPAICSTLPNATNPTGFTHVLDLGANVDSTAESLLEFAFMGDALAEAIFDLESPTVGLLNIGEEEIKGNEIIAAIFVNIFALNSSLRKPVSIFAAPSVVFNITLPMKPSQTTTSTELKKILSPSTKPI